MNNLQKQWNNVRREQVLMAVGALSVLSLIILLQTMTTPKGGKRDGSRSHSRPKSKGTRVKSGSPSNIRSVSRKTDPKRKRQPPPPAAEPTVMADDSRASQPAEQLTVELLEQHKKLTSMQKKDVIAALGPQAAAAAAVRAAPGAMENSKRMTVLRCSVAATEGSTPAVPLPSPPAHHHHAQGTAPPTEPPVAATANDANAGPAAEHSTSGAAAAAQRKEHNERMKNRSRSHAKAEASAEAGGDESPSPQRRRVRKHGSKRHRDSSGQEASASPAQPPTPARGEKRRKSTGHVEGAQEEEDEDMKTPSPLRVVEEVSTIPSGDKKQSAADDTQLSSLAALLGTAGGTPPSAVKAAGDEVPGYLMAEARDTLRRLTQDVADDVTNKKKWMCLYLFAKQIPYSCLSQVLSGSVVTITPTVEPKVHEAGAGADSDGCDADEAFKLLQRETLVRLKPHSPSQPPASLSSVVRRTHFEWRNGDIVRRTGELLQLSGANASEREVDCDQMEESPPLRYSDLLVSSEKTLPTDDAKRPSADSPDLRCCSDADRLAALVFCFRRISRSSGATQSSSPAPIRDEIHKNDLESSLARAAASGAGAAAAAAGGGGGAAAVGEDGVEDGGAEALLSGRAASVLKGLVDLKKQPFFQSLRSIDSAALFLFDLQETITAAEALLKEYEAGGRAVLLSPKQLRGMTLTSSTPTRPSAFKKMSISSNGNSNVTTPLRSGNSTALRSPSVPLANGVRGTSTVPRPPAGL